LWVGTRCCIRLYEKATQGNDPSHPKIKTTKYEWIVMRKRHCVIVAEPDKRSQNSTNPEKNRPQNQRLRFTVLCVRHTQTTSSLENERAYLAGEQKRAKTRGPLQTEEEVRSKGESGKNVRQDGRAAGVPHRPCRPLIAELDREGRSKKAAMGRLNGEGSFIVSPIVRGTAKGSRNSPEGTRLKS